MDAQYTEWIRRWQAALNACQRKGGEASELVIAPPASAEAVAQVEAELGVILPVSFRKVLTNFSAEVNIYWFLPNDLDLPVPYKPIFSGDCSWSLSRMPGIAHWYLEWVETNFFNPNDPYDRVWQDKLAFAEVPNGDNIAFDLMFMPDPPVVYLSHNDGEGHDYRLGDNFIDFMERWSLLGCPGNEDWQMMPFLPNATSGLDAYGENARKWREWFGLDFEAKNL